jgi:hypothetical protein
MRDAENMTPIQQVDLARGARCGIAALDNDTPALNRIIEEAEREERVSNLIAALSSMMAGNAVHLLGKERSREEFDKVILRARMIDETPGDPA